MCYLQKFQSSTLWLLNDDKEKDDDDCNDDYDHDDDCEMWTDFFCMRETVGYIYLSKSIIIISPVFHGGI